MSGSITVDAGHGLELIVTEPTGADGMFDAQLWHTESREPMLITFSYGVRVAMTGTEVTGLWFGDTKFTLSWKSSLKVADFLRLEIPLPVPLGEQVPA